MTSAAAVEAPTPPSIATRLAISVNCLDRTLTTPVSSRSSPNLSSPDGFLELGWLGRGAGGRGDFVQAVEDRLQAALCVQIETVEDRLRVFVGVRRAGVRGEALDVLPDHDHRQQDQLEERLGDPGDDSLAAGF